MPRPGTSQQLQQLQQLLSGLVSRRPGEAQPVHTLAGSAMPSAQAVPHQLLSSTVPQFVGGRKMPSDLSQWTADDWQWYNSQMGITSGFTPHASDVVKAAPSYITPAHQTAPKGGALTVPGFQTPGGATNPYHFGEGLPEINIGSPRPTSYGASPSWTDIIGIISSFL